MTKRSIFAVSVLMAVAVATSVFANGPVATYGRLFADGNKIVGEKSNGEAVQLKGPSMQWSVVGWGSDKFFLSETVDALVDGWKAQVIRVPLGISHKDPNDPSDEVMDGYNITPEANWGRVERVTDAAIARGVYAIVDWHSHSAHNPEEIELAIDFFTNPKLAGKYGNNPAVIFEIYNEPTDLPKWADDVKPAANAVIKAIRDAGFNNLILVGSPHWDTETDIAAKDPPKDSLNNFALTFHFYAAAHRIGTRPYFSPVGTTYRSVVQDALDAGFPVFVSEWGTNNATDYGAPNFVESDKWHAYLDSNKLSSCAWGVTASGYYGANALDYWVRWGNPIHFDYSELANWVDPFRMTPHGRYVYRWLTGNDTTIAGMPYWPVFAGLSSRIELPPTASAGWGTIANEGGETELEWGSEDGVLSISYKLDKGTYEWDPYVGVNLETGELSRCRYGIGYDYMGSAHSLRAEQSNVTDWDYHINYKPTPAAGDWRRVSVPWGYFWQEEWGGVQTAQRDNSLIERIAWFIIGKSGNSGELSVKNVQCLGDPDGEEYVSIRQGRVPARSNNSASFLRMSGKTLQLRFAQSGKVDVYNLKGAKIRTIKLKQGDHNVRMNGLPKGIYVVRANCGGWSQSVKMLIR